jgi:hypothetical protein
MGKSPGQSASAIESLLSERSQFEQWLAKLAASSAPESVREKVRADYEQRLAKVMESLREHGDAIDAELQRHESSRTDLERREASSLETMSEAELRHSVGEFDAGKWDEISRSQKAALDGIRSELTRVRGEIARLSEVQASIAGEEARKASAPEPEPVKLPAAARSAPAAVPDATRTAPKADRPKDELDFLKSVAVDQSSSLSAQAAAGNKLPPEPPAPIAPPAPEPASAKASEAPSQGRSSGSSSQAKTLKCGECGTLNRPTEWYCERCGAELAAL